MRGVAGLRVLEERRVDRTGGVVEGQEDDPPAGPDRRGLGRHLDPGHQHLGPAAAAAAGRGAGDAERRRGTARRSRGRAGWRRGRGSRARRAPARSAVISGSPLGIATVGSSPRSRASWTSEPTTGPGPATGGRPGPVRHPDRQARPALRGSGAGGAPPAALGGRPRPLVEVEHLQQQVAPGHRSPALDRHRRADAVERVEGAGQHQPLGDRAGDPGAVPEVGERVVGPAADDAGQLAVVDALDVGEAEPDAVAPGVGQRRRCRAARGWTRRGSAAAARRGRRPARRGSRRRRR